LTEAASPARQAAARLLLVVFDFHGFQVFRFKNLPAVQAFYIVDAVSSGKNLGTGVLASGLHNSA